MALKWESALTDEPGDQNADSGHSAHAYWSLGPTHGGQWGVELIVRDDDLEELVDQGVRLGHFPDEDEAKRAAQAHEDEALHSEGDGCAIYPDPWYTVVRSGEEVRVDEVAVGDVITEGGYEPALVRRAGRDGEDVHLDLGPVDSDA